MTFAGSPICFAWALFGILENLTDIMGLLFVALVILAACLLIRFAYFVLRAVQYAKPDNPVFLVVLLRLWQFETAKQYILSAGHVYLRQARKSLFWFLATLVIGFVTGLLVAI